MAKVFPICSMAVFAAFLAVIFSMIPLGAQAAPLCPLTSDTRRTIIFFDGSIISGSGGITETSAFVTSVPAGTYDIILVSYDDHNGEATQSAEQWFLMIKNKAGSPIGWSQEIGDLPDGQQFLTETVNFSYHVTETITAVTARHITVYDSGQHSIIPVCAAFDLKDGSPLVTTDVATSITDDEATIQGSVNTNGSSYTVGWFEWGAISFPLGSKTPERHIASSEDMSERIMGLKKNTRYYFRVAARNVANTSYGPTLSFITAGGPVQTSPSPLPSSSPCSSCLSGSSQSIVPPTTLTLLPTFVSQNTVVLNGRVVADIYGGTNVWFEWGKDANLGLATTKKGIGHVRLSADFNDTLKGLSPNTLYYFRAVAENTKARSHGATLLFRTLPVGESVSMPVQSLFQSPSPIIHNPISSTRLQATSFNQGLRLITFTIEPSDEMIKVGTVVPFEITFENISDDLLTNAVLTILLPPELIYQDMSGYSADGEKDISINKSLDLITIQIGDIVKGKKESITIRALLKSDTIDRKIFTTSAVMTYEDQTSQKGREETIFAVNTASAHLGFAALLFAGGFYTWFIVGLLGLLLLFLIFFLLKRRKKKEEEEIKNIKK